jgi:hypothetical protein
LINDNSFKSAAKRLKSKVNNKIYFIYLIRKITMIGINTNSRPLELLWHHLKSDFQALLNLNLYFDFFAAGALGDALSFGILTSSA